MHIPLPFVGHKGPTAGSHDGNASDVASSAAGTPRQSEDDRNRLVSDDVLRCTKMH